MSAFFAGVLALVALQTVVSSTGAADRATGALALIPKAIAWIVDPTIPAIPNRKHPSQKAG